MNESRFAIIPADAIDDLSLTAMDLRVLGVIAYHAGRDRTAWPKQSTIAARLKITRVSVNRCISRLKKRGYVEVAAQTRRDGGQRESVYYVPLDPAFVRQAIVSRQEGDPQPAPPPCNPTDTPPVTASVTPIEEQTIRTKPPKPPRGRAGASLGIDPIVLSTFEILWRDWPDQGKERSGGRDLCLREFVKATAKAAPDALKLAAMAYRQKTPARYAVGLNRWLKMGQYENFLPSPQAVKRTEERKLVQVNGKAGECLDAIRRRYGEAVTRAWLADAKWTDALVILPSTFQAAQVHNRFAPVLELFGFSVTHTEAA